MTVPVSAGLLTDTDAYFEALTTCRQGDPEPIILATVNASFRAITNGRQLVADLRRIRESWNERIRARSHSAKWENADLMIRQAVVNAKILNNDHGVGPSQISRRMDVITHSGVTKQTKFYPPGVVSRAEGLTVGEGAISR